MTFEDWVKKIKCNNCGKLGHIKRDYPKLAGNRNGSDRRNQDNHQGGRQSFQRDNRRTPVRQDKRSYKEKRQFKKVYLTAMEELLRDFDSDDSKCEKEQEASIEEDDKSDASNLMNDLAAHAARMMSLLKE